MWSAFLMVTRCFCMTSIFANGHSWEANVVLMGQRRSVDLVADMFLEPKDWYSVTLVWHNLSGARVVSRHWPMKEPNMRAKRLIQCDISLTQSLRGQSGVKALGNDRNQQTTILFVYVCMDDMLVSNCNQIIMRLGEEITVTNDAGHVQSAPSKHYPQKVHAQPIPL